jgi:5'-3' exonuclease
MHPLVPLNFVRISLVFPFRLERVLTHSFVSFPSTRGSSLRAWLDAVFADFQLLCIMRGNDYLPALHGLGFHRSWNAYAYCLSCVSLSLPRSLWLWLAGALDVF